MSADFASAQLLNEYVRTAQRKLGREWREIGRDLELLRDAVPDIRPIDAQSNRDAVRIAERYRLQFFDGLMIAVALANRATTLYSEDMQHGLVVDDSLTILNPFLSTEPE
jgi:predicted nucleic acid-binding protein